MGNLPIVPPNFCKNLCHRPPVAQRVQQNGHEICFFSDIDEKNKMDKKPFFVFDLQNYDEHQVLELTRFQKDKFDIGSILDAASNLKYVKTAGQYISSQLLAAASSLMTTTESRFAGFTSIQNLRNTSDSSMPPKLRRSIR
jgi:hypothetical protein